MFENQRALAPENLKQYAVDLELDTSAFNECLDSGKHRERVQENYLHGQQLGVTGTPAFFINGRFLTGAVPFEQFQAIIDDELSR